MIRRLLSSWSVRCVMVGIWTVIVIGFLYTPQLSHLFHVDEIREDKSINLFVWPMMITAEQLVPFEQETGIKVYMHYYESNEELLQKLRVTQGKGYDLVMPADYIVDILRKEKLIQKIDTSKLTFLKYLNPLLLNHYHDPGNQYSIPYFLGIYGLGVDTHYFGDNQPPATWKLLFEHQPQGYEVTITDVPRRAIAIAGKYLFGNAQAIKDPAKLAEVEKLLIRQKAWIRMYTDIRGEDLLATKNCPVVMTIASDLWMIKREHPHLAFVLPAEGTFVAIDSFVIPAASEKQDLVYQLLNYMYQPKFIKYHATRYGFCPPTTNVDIAGSGIFCPTKEQFAKFDFFQNVVPESDLNNVWVSVLAH